MSEASTLYTARIEGPEYLERGRTQSVELPIYRDGVLAAPTAGTFSLFDAADAVVVDALAITITADIATFSVTAAEVPADQQPGERWRILWQLTLADGLIRSIGRDATVVRRTIFPTITLADLVRHHSDLATLLAGSNDINAQGYIDESWRIIINRLEAQNVRANLILSPWSLREVHIWLALELFSLDAHTSMLGDSKYLELAELYRDRYERAWSSLNFSYDSDNDGAIDDADRTAAVSVVMLSDAPAAWRGRRGP